VIGGRGVGVFVEKREKEGGRGGHPGLFLVRKEEGAGAHFGDLERGGGGGRALESRVAEVKRRGEGRADSVISKSVIFFVGDRGGEKKEGNGCSIPPA